MLRPSLRLVIPAACRRSLYQPQQVSATMHESAVGYAAGRHYSLMVGPQSLPCTIATAQAMLHTPNCIYTICPTSSSSAPAVTPH
jgi:hypothetical protein